MTQIDMTEFCLSHPQTMWKGSVQSCGDGRFMIVKSVRKVSNAATGTAWFGRGPEVNLEERQIAVAAYNTRPDVAVRRAEIAARAKRVFDAGY